MSCAKRRGRGPAIALACFPHIHFKAQNFFTMERATGPEGPHSRLAVFISVHYTSSMSEAAMSNESWSPELGRIVGGGVEYSTPHKRILLFSHAMRSPDAETPTKAVHEVTIRDVNIGLEEIRLTLGDLEAVAFFHPVDGVAQMAQVILADVAGLVLRTWPADAAKSLQPRFKDLYVREGGAFRLRWDREHKTGQRTLGGSKRQLLHHLLFHRVWPLHQTCSFDVITDASGIRVVDFDHINRCFYDPAFVKSLRSFYRSVPDLIESCKNETDAMVFSFRATLTHFDMFWDMVIDPYIFEGTPSLWNEFTNGKFAGSKSPSDSRKQLKRMLLKFLRSCLPDIVVKTSVD